MTQSGKLASAAFLAALVATGSLAAEPPRQAAPQNRGHAFAAADYTQGKVLVVSAEGRVEWEHEAPNSNDLWALPSGNLLFTTGHGVLEVTRSQQVVFKYESQSEIYACQRLPNGNTFVGECTAGRLIEVAPDGKIVSALRLLPPGQDGGHTYMRNARHLSNGHFLVAHYGLDVVREYDATGRVVFQVPAPGGPHSVVRLPHSHTLIACGDQRGEQARVFEVDRKGRTVWEIKGDDLPGASLKFMGGLQRLPNGNTVITNWLGHGHFGEAPLIIEVTPDKRVVWTYADHQAMKTASSVQLLDVPGNAVKGEILH